MPVLCGKICKMGLYTELFYAMYTAVADPGFWKGVVLQAAEGSRTEARSADQSVRSAEKFFAFIFQLSGWALVAPSCFLHSKFQM